MVPTLTRLHETHRHLNWLFVYTLEAHAVDEWPISSSRYNPSGEVVSIRQHTTLEERFAAAGAFRQAFPLPFPTAVDGIDNAFEAVFSTWPFRFYIIEGARVAFQSQPRECTHSLEAFARALESL